MGSSGLLLTQNALSNQHTNAGYSYGKISTLADALTREGLVNIRIAFKSSEPATIQKFTARVSVAHGKINRIKKYFFKETNQPFAANEFQLSVSHEQPNILALWIEKPGEKTRVSISANSATESFTLADLLENQEITRELNDVSITANILPDREIAEISPGDFKATDPGANFRIVVMADPQGGDPEEKGNHPTRMKIHNAWAEESITQANIMEPAVTLILGDIVDSQGEERNFIRMGEFFRKLRSPILYAIGNHETIYRATFTPGYNMEAFNNYFDAQRNINGLELMLYSFNMGEWHFIVWPDPLRANFWETHPHYFDWLERDLEKHKNRPTIFFQHVPAHPIGIDPLINYAESVDVKRTLLNIIAKHRNVKFVFSGHVHIPVKASFKTAISYRGMKMINLPPAGYRPRAFGEEDYHGGPCQGILVLDFDRENCTATYRTVMEEEYVYPDSLPEYDENTFRLWLNHKWQLPAEDNIINGNFAKNLDGWTRRYVYTEDKDPSNICETVTENGRSALFIFSRKRGFDQPGQDRLPQTINRVCQVVKLKDGTWPILDFQYKINEKTDLEGWCGAYVWIEGFAGAFKKLNLIYSSGIAYSNLGESFSKSEFTKNVHLGLSDIPGKWHDVSLNIPHDFNTSYDTSFKDLDLERLAISLGVWTINDAADYPYGIYFTGFNLRNGSDGFSSVDGAEILPKPEKKIWWLGKYFPFRHTAGDHRYILGTKKMTDWR